MSPLHFPQKVMFSGSGGSRSYSNPKVGDSIPASPGPHADVSPGKTAYPKLPLAALLTV